MGEPAHWFFSLLNYAFKIDAEEKMHFIQSVSVPHMKQEDAQSVISGYREAARDTMDIIEAVREYKKVEKNG